MIIKNKGDWVGTKQDYLVLDEIVKGKKYYITDLAKFAISNADMALALTTEKTLYVNGDIFICKDSGIYTKGCVYQFTVVGTTASWTKLVGVTASDIVANNTQTVQANLERIDEALEDRQITYLISEYPATLDEYALYRVEQEFTHGGKTYAVGLYQVENNDLIKIQTGVPNSYIPLTTAPTADNTDGTIKVVLLNNDPATYYDGYDYRITEA